VFLIYNIGPGPAFYKKDHDGSIDQKFE